MPSLHALAIGLLACASSVLGENSVPTAKTKNGTYYGTHASKWDQDYFQRIPYAQPPGPTQQVLGEYVSEDCLTLNIFRSNNGTSASKLLPIVLYIHGGLFKQGSGRDPRYDMTSLLQVAVQNNQQFTGVTLNYRLSYWGFLYGQEVAEEGVANLGLKDQRLALRWISGNIKAFGGDPEKFTIWGQEAGAYSVGLQLLAYGGRDDGLFRGAVAQSGSPTLMWPSITAKEWQPLYNKFVNATNCTGSSDTLNCLRNFDASSLSDVSDSDITTLERVNPFVDGDFIRELGSKALEAGNFVKVPLMMGTTQDEGAWSYYGVENINTTSEFLDMVLYDGLSESAAKKIAQFYPDDPAQGIPSTLIGRPGNETGLGYQWERWAKHNVSVHTYVYDVLFHAKWWQYGAQEQDDIAFFFHNVTLSESLSPTDQADQKKTFEPLSYLLTSMLISFINTQDPNNVPMNGTVSWPKYSVKDPKALVFDVNATERCRVEKDNFRSEAIENWIDLFSTNEYPQ
ncbi:carboxylesterase family protein [Penicillium malachiteum]|uniref:carboxylesterase family protein n=1 Tax=Penicillium malachiteum TaxID=1324776 RepID=UPI002548A73B|nr:carboxylesterase family protein [Penicillium malachiteum]KAJ5714558.1 carboxylesterase family protein [Penicillium malachiteum]